MTPSSGRGRRTVKAKRRGRNCGVCGGRGFRSIMDQETIALTDVDCHGCKGTGRVGGARVSAPPVVAWVHTVWSGLSIVKPGIATARTHKEAQALRQSSIRFGLMVGPIVRIEVPAPAPRAGRKGAK